MQTYSRRHTTEISNNVLFEDEDYIYLRRKPAWDEKQVTVGHALRFTLILVLIGIAGGLIMGSIGYSAYSEMEQSLTHNLNSYNERTQATKSTVIRR